MNWKFALSNSLTKVINDIFFDTLHVSDKYRIIKKFFKCVETTYETIFAQKLLPINRHKYDNNYEKVSVFDKKNHLSEMSIIFNVFAMMYI